MVFESVTLDALARGSDLHSMNKDRYATNAPNPAVERNIIVDNLPV